MGTTEEEGGQAWPLSFQFKNIVLQRLQMSSSHTRDGKILDALLQRTDAIIPVWDIKLAVPISGLQARARQQDASHRIQQQKPRLSPLIPACGDGQERSSGVSI